MNVIKRNTGHPGRSRNTNERIVAKSSKEHCFREVTALPPETEMSYQELRYAVSCSALFWLGAGAEGRGGGAWFASADAISPYQCNAYVKQYLSVDVARCLPKERTKLNLQKSI